MRYELVVDLREKSWNESLRCVTIELHNSGINDLDIINAILSNPDKIYSLKILIDKGVKRILQDIGEDNYYVDGMKICSMEESEVANYFLWVDLDLKEYSVRKVNFEMIKLE